METEKGGLLQRIRDEFSFVRGNFLVMVISWLVLDFFIELPGTYYPLYVEALGGTATTIGIIGSVSLIAAAVVQIPGGFLADKYGRKWLIVSMTFMAALARIFYVYAPSWEWIMVGAVVVGLCGIYKPALNAIIADSVPKEKRGMGFSIINMIASVSTTPAPLFAGYLFTIYGLVPSMRLIYKLVIGGLMVAALLRTKLTETVENPEKIKVSELLGEYPASMRESLKVWDLVPRAAFILFIVDVVMNFTSGLFQPILVLYMVKDLGISELQLSYVWTIFSVSILIFALPAGKLIDMIGKKKPIMAAFVLWVVAILLMVNGNYIRAILSMITVGLLMVMANSALGALNAGLVPKEHRGKVNGSTGFFRLIAAALGQFTGGWLFDNVNHQIPFLIQIALVCIPLFLVYFYIDENEETLH